MTQSLPRTRRQPGWYRRARQLQPGDWIVIFGTASQILKVDKHEAYPLAVILWLRPAGFTTDVQTLVPSDYEPIVLPDRRP
jgi:hypothetical protein